MAKKRKYKIYWKSNITGFRGESGKPMSKNAAFDLADEMNRKFPDIVHTAHVYLVE